MNASKVLKEYSKSQNDSLEEFDCEKPGKMLGHFFIDLWRSSFLGINVSLDSPRENKIHT